MTKNLVGYRVLGGFLRPCLTDIIISKNNLYLKSNLTKRIGKVVEEKFVGDTGFTSVVDVVFEVEDTVKKLIDEKKIKTIGFMEDMPKPLRCLLQGG